MTTLLPDPTSNDHAHHQNWMKTMKRTTIVAGAVLVLAACGADAPVPAQRDLEPVAVTVTESWTAASPAVHPARVVPLEEAEVATRIAGTVDRIAVRVGDRVAAGDLVAALDDGDVRARIEGARAQEELARKTFDRIRNLERDGAASTQELDQARAQLTSAQAMVREAEAQAAYVEILAPFSGIVTARMADAGDLAGPGQPLVRLSGDGVKVVAELPSELAGTVSAGQDVLLETGRSVGSGVVRSVVPSLDRASRRFQVEITPADGSALLPGAFVRVTLARDAGDTRWIPADAVVRNGQLTGVFTVEDDVLRLRWIRTGRARGEAVELLAGPAGSVTVVRAPSGALRDGQPVSSVTRAPAPDARGSDASTTSQEG